MTLQAREEGTLTSFQTKTVSGEGATRSDRSRIWRLGCSPPASALGGEHGEGEKAPEEKVMYTCTCVTDDEYSSYIVYVCTCTYLCLQYVHV